MNESKQMARFGQSWMCAFAPPLDTCEMLISERVSRGMQVAGRRVRETRDEGHVVITQAYSPELGRHSFIAALVAATNDKERRRLIDADIEWMGPKNFSLEGLYCSAAYSDVPVALYDGGWLCMFRQPMEPEPGERRSSFERAMRGVKQHTEAAPYASKPTIEGQGEPAAML